MNDEQRSLDRWGKDRRVMALLMSDVVGSVRRWEGDPKGTARSIAALDHLVERVVARRRGHVVRDRGEGDSHFCVFDSPADCLQAAVEIQRGLVAEDGGDRLQTRVAVHAGEVAPRRGDLYGPAVNRCARIRELCHGGQILVSSALAHMIDWTASDVRLRPLGPHRLRDLIDPEELYQAVGDGLQESFPPLRSLSRHPNNLPPQLSSFVGRTREIALVTELLRDHRLVTLTGPGGSGKTRLALQTGAELSDDCPQGIWFVDLSAAKALDAVPTTVCAELAIPMIDPLAGLCDHLSDGIQILILDNCEHVIDACRDLAQHVLRHCGAARVLATSRRRLGVPGEHVFRCPGLGVPSDDDPESVRESDAARLLVERADAQGCELTISEATAASIGQLCRRLDGLPLPIELVASILPVLSPEEVGAQLGDLLSRPMGTTTMVERQRTMATVLEWSLSLLDERATELLSRMAIFSGAVSLDSVGEVCAYGRIRRQDILDHLNVLVDQSLVLAHRLPSGKVRFRMLISTRDVMRARRRRDPSLQSRFRRHFLAFAEDAEARTAAGIEEFEEDYPNVLVALDEARQAGEDSWRSAVVQLRFYWLKSGRYREGLEWLRRALAELGDEPLLRGRALNAIGALCVRVEDNEGALRALREAEALLGPRGGIDAIKVRLNLAILESRAKNHAVAEAHLRSCESECRKVGDQATLAVVLINLGVERMAVDRYDEETLGLFERAAQTAREAGMLLNEATALQNAAETQLLRGDARSALEYALRSFRLGEGVNEVYELAGTLAMLSLAFARLEKAGPSAAMLAASERLVEEYDLSFKARQQNVHREASVWLKDHPEALRMARRTVRRKTKSELFGLAGEIVRATLDEPVQ